MARRKSGMTFGAFIIIVLAALFFFAGVGQIQKFWSAHPAISWLIFAIIIAIIIVGVILYIKRKLFD